MRPDKKSRFKPTPTALALLACFAAAPAIADTEIDALRRELAEQRALIQQLMQAQQHDRDVQTGGPTRGSGLQAQTAATATRRPPARAG
jgi:hypothetical protein